jgi:putative transposase
MANKRPKREEIVTKLRQVEVLTGQGMPRLEAIRQIGVTEQTFYRWKKKYSGMGTDQLKELKRLQKENERLRKAVSDLMLDKLIIAEAAKGPEGQPRSTSMDRSPDARFLRSDRSRYLGANIYPASPERCWRAQMGNPRVWRPRQLAGFDEPL